METQSEPHNKRKGYVIHWTRLVPTSVNKFSNSSFYQPLLNRLNYSGDQWVHHRSKKQQHQFSVFPSDSTKPHHSTPHKLSIESESYSFSINFLFNMFFLFSFHFRTIMNFIFIYTFLYTLQNASYVSLLRWIKIYFEEFIHAFTYNCRYTNSLKIFIKLF